MCTRNLWRAIGGGAALPVRGGGVVGETKLGGWSLRELPTRDGNLVVGLEETTYLTILCPLLPQPAFVGVFSAAVEAALQDLEVPDDVAEAEARAIVEDVRFAKNDNRSLLGSVNDVAFHAGVLLEPERSITFAALRRIQGSSITCHTCTESRRFPTKQYVLSLARRISLKRAV